MTAEQIEAILKAAREDCKANPSLRIGQAVFNQLRNQDLIKMNPAKGSLEDLVDDGSQPYWLKADGGQFTDMFEYIHIERVRAVMYNEFWQGQI